MRRIVKNHITLFGLSLVTVVWIAAGCEKTGEIQRYTVPKQPIIVPDPVVATDGAGGDQEVDMARDRMIAAIVPREQKAWFFKLTGPNQVVTDLMEEFLSLINSLQFKGPGDTPQWTLPEGWHQETASQMRFATIKIDAGDRPLDLSVIPLPMSGGDLDEYILSNVNRWRGQLRLRPIAQGQLFNSEKRTEESIRIDLEDGTQVTLVNLVGFLESGPMGRAPFASQASRAAAPPSSLKYSVPDGWKPTQGTAFSKAAFAVMDGQEKVEITISDLSAAAASLLPNVNRWRNQIQLDDIDQLQLDKQRQAIEIGPLTGDYVELIGPETAKPRETGKHSEKLPETVRNWELLLAVSFF